jgi:hypothetical protein
MLTKQQRVQPTRAAIENGVLRPSDRGIVVGFSYRKPEIRVIRDGLKTPENYHRDFWAPEKRVG